jgi:hypothetical protein
MQHFLIRKSYLRGALGVSESNIGISIICYGKNRLHLRLTWLTTSPGKRIEFVSQGPTVDGDSVTRPHLKDGITYTFPNRWYVQPVESILASAMISRSRGVRCKSTFIPPVGIDLIAPVTIHIAPGPNITWPDIPACDRTVCRHRNKFSQHIQSEKFCILPNGVLVSNALMYGSNAGKRMFKNLGNDVPCNKCIAVSCSHLTWHQFLQTYCSYQTSC